MPRACLACGRRLGMRERHLCLSCAADVPYTRFWLAPHNPLADRFNAVLERHRGTEPMDSGRPGGRAALRRPPGPPPRRRPALRGHRPGHPRPPPLDPPSLPRLQPSRNPRPRPCLRLPLRPCSRPCSCPCSCPRPCPCRPDPGCSSHRGSLYHIRFRSVGEMAGRSDWVAPTTISSAARSPSSTVPSIASSSGPSERWPVVVGHDDGAVPAAPAPTSSSGTSERWPVAAGHDDGVAPTIVSSAVPSTAIPGTPTTVSSDAPSVVIPGGTRNLPEVRTDLLVRARRTRSQTRVSVDQKARNVASAFQVPIRFSLWSRLISRLAQFFSSFLARWPIGVGHDGNHLSRQIETPLSRHDDNHLLDQNENSLSDLDGNHLSSQIENHLSSHDDNHLSDQDENHLPERNGNRHSRLDRESPADVLASARHILLVDDTYTTGATLYACYAALRPFTTARISIATLAAVEGTPSLVGPSSGTGGP